MKNNYRFAAVIFLSVTISCTDKKNEKESFPSPIQSYKIKNDKGKCCASNVPSRFPVNIQPFFSKRMGNKKNSK